MGQSQRHASVGTSPDGRWLNRWVGFVAGHPLTVLLATAALTVAAILHSASAVRMNSDVSTLLSQDEPFRRDFRDYTTAFPELADTTLVVVSSASLQRASDAVQRLGEALERRTDLIASVFAPGTGEFFRQHALLYLERKKLAAVVDRLAEAQPALAALARDQSLRALLRQLEMATDNLQEGRDAPGSARIANQVAAAAEGLLSGEPQAISWADEFIGGDATVYHRLLIVQGRSDFAQRIPSQQLVQGIRDTAAELGLTPENGVRVRLTGTVPLLHEEQEAVQVGLSLAAMISVALLALLLYFGIRSVPIIVATLVSLFVSLCWTTSFAMLTVGEFNMISAAFAVLLIGLGGDFAVHVGLRYEDEFRAGDGARAALTRAVTVLGGALSLCALTSAIGFLSFVPTPYHALGDLGIISAGGVFISLLASFTVFPAILAVMPEPKPRPATPGVAVFVGYELPNRYPRTVLAISAVLGISAALASTRIEFDFSNLSMRDPQSESVTTLQEIQAEGIVTDYAATVLAPDLASSEELAARLAALAPVASVETPMDFVPREQAAKLELIDDAAFFLEPALNPPTEEPAPTAEERMTALLSLRDRIAELPTGRGEDDSRLAMRRLGSALDRIAIAPSAAALAAQLETLVIADLPDRLDWLREALATGPVGFEDLPRSLRSRLVDARGRARLSVLPRGDMSEVDDLREFVAAVKTVAPHATGRPPVEVGVGDLVVESFRIAIFISLVLIAVVMLLYLRDPVDVLVLLAPILLGALFTIAMAVLIDMPFNMSNVVAIPLVMGLGVDTAIHMVLRFRESGSLAETMASSTPRAAILSALTTLAAFGSLSVSGHLGIRSLGLLLAISVFCLIFTSLVILPATIILRRPVRRWIYKHEAAALRGGR